MNRKILLFGSVFAVFIIVLASFNSVTAAQTMDDTTFNRFIDRFVNRLQEDDRFKDVDVNEMTTIFQNPQFFITSHDGWYPGFLISWLNYWMMVFIDTIIRGEWFPGLIVFFMILDVLFFLWSLLQGGGPD